MERGIKEEMSVQPPTPPKKQFETPTLKDFHKDDPPQFTRLETFVYGTIALLVITAVFALGVWFVESANKDADERLQQHEQQEQAEKVIEDAEKELESFCIINGFGNKLCGADALAFCDMRMRQDDEGTLPMDEASKEACRI